MSLRSAFSPVTNMQLPVCAHFHGPCDHHFPVSGIATPAGPAIGVFIHFHSYLTLFQISEDVRDSHQDMKRSIYVTFVTSM
jgi:hypothetical protein